MSAPTTPLPEWASNANHPAGAHAWSGQPNKDDTSMVFVAATGMVPAEPIEAEGVNAWWNLAWQWIEHSRTAMVDRFGDGSDGNVTMGDGTPGFTGLSRDWHFGNLTIRDQHFCLPNGNRIYCSGTLTLESGASILDDGDDATDENGADGADGSNVLLGGGDGADGVIGNGTQAAALTYTGGGGGGAGGSSATQAAGAARAASRSDDGSWRAYPNSTILRVWDNDTPARVGGGVGGSSGGSSGVASGGGGGGGGGVIVICCHRLVLPTGGLIAARGGNGGPGTANSAGGGGGGGGLIVIVCREVVDDAGSVDVSGGTGGLGNGTGNNGAAGQDGTFLFIRG
jgi:hypothetical protein